MRTLLFSNRAEAGLRLAGALEKFRGTDSVILAIPRGGVEVAKVVAETLSLPLDIALSKKIGHPANSEYAIGSVSPDTVVLDEHADVSQEYILRETKKIRELLQKRYDLYMGARKPVALKGRTAIVVDDGIATGNTLLATIRTLRKKEPRSIVVAVPVAPSRGTERIKTEADEFICLYTPADFPGVSAFYADFAQVSDEEVVQLLSENAPHGSEKEIT
ncbi:MAG TPA: phosphoribosyltransferase family protein [Bacteroidia bacterium]|nr:phosphoribosyltransferase family protein [Bacteroidia bacterium]